MKIEVNNAEAVIEKTINENGIVMGLKKWSNKKVKVIVLEESE